MRPTAPNAPLRPFQIAADFLDRLRDPEADRIVALADGAQAGEQCVLLGDAALHLDDQHRLGVERVAGMGERLAGVDRRAVHEFQRHRDDAGADDGVDTGAGDLVGAERGEHGPRALGAAQDAHGDLGDDGELALASRQQAEPVVAGGVEMCAADLENLAVDGDQFQAEQVVGGDTVFQAMRAAGVHRDVAADHAGELAGGVGGIEEAMRGDGIGDADIGDAGLHHGAAVGVVDVEDAVHPHQADHHGVRQRQRAAGKRGAGAARDDPHAVGMAVAQDGGDLLGGLGQDNRERHLAVGGQAVGLVGPQADGLGDQCVRGHESGEAGDDLVAPRHDVRFGIGKPHARPIAVSVGRPTREIRAGRPGRKMGRDGGAGKQVARGAAGGTLDRLLGNQRPQVSRDSTLAALHPRVLLVDDIDAAVAADHPAILVAHLGRLQTVANSHDTGPGGESERREIGGRPGVSSRTTAIA